MTITWKMKETGDLAAVEGNTQVKVADIVEPKLLSVKQLCKYLNIGERTARKLLGEYDCPYVCRVGGRVFANKTVLDRWLDSNTGRI